MTDTVLWCQEGTSDKLWGVVDHHTRAITFWGRRTAELSFKLLTRDEQDGLDKLIATKKKKRGYFETTFERLEEEAPGFRAKFDQMLLMAILGDNYRNTDPATIADM